MLKQGLIIIICFLTFNICHAQFSKKTIYANGFGSYSYEQGKNVFISANDVVQNVMLTPSIGFLPIDNLIAGVKLNYMSTRTDTDYGFLGAGSAKGLSKSYNVGPFVRYYMVKGLYAETSYFWGKGKQVYYMIGNGLAPNGTPDPTIKISPIESSYNSNGYLVGVGYTFFLSKFRNVGLDLGLVYKGYFHDGTSYKGFSAGLGISGFLFRQKE